jgi:hypothetical protein
MYHLGSSEDLIQTFTRQTAPEFELSFVDNTVIKLTINGTEHAINFSNVHKKHQFAELYNMEKFVADNITPVPPGLMDNDFKVMSITWNMGQENCDTFATKPQLLFDKANEKYDLIVICAQECRKKFKQQRLHELEQHFTPLGFV